MSRSFDSDVLDGASILVGMRENEGGPAETDTTVGAAGEQGGHQDPGPSDGDEQTVGGTVADPDAEDDGDGYTVGETLAGVFEIHRVGEHARLRPSPSGQAVVRPPYSSSTGRHVQPLMQSYPRVGLPRADTRAPGQYVFINRQTDPNAFHTSAHGGNVLPQPKIERLRAALRTEGRGSDGTSLAEPDDDEEMAESSPSLPEEIDDDDTGDYGVPGPSRRSRPVPAVRSGIRPAADADDGEEEESEDEEIDEDDVAATAGGPTGVTAANGNHRSWKLKQPQPLPLYFNVPTGPDSWKREPLPAHKTINFDDAASVQAANKYARQIIHRARKALSLPPLRPSTQGREYDQEKDDVLGAIMISYAEQHNGAQIALRELTALYNAEYPNENRLQSSIATHVDRIKELKAERDSYRA
ncbi:hypothetical protein LTR36_007205 [Oleoguttula mirabilis]|uniref:Uncharacterized protein n=1 Tax=Oleoguttula mirabilis TaxID=1507867 RepID=A0AAV9JAS7_9PEZI|nr:hypothetical protein LTR36_007205 [Oleoguttula mirabilis]